MSNTLQSFPYLPRQRNFPTDSAQVLGVELDKSYIDIAQRVNERIIGIFTVNIPSITGESWYVNGQPYKQQTMRQVYTFGAIASGAILLINYVASGFTEFSRIYGTCITDFPDNRPIPYAAITATAGIEVRVTNNRIVIFNGPTAPNIISGKIVLEWLTFQQNSNP